jgi:hypothetical protein
VRGAIVVIVLCAGTVARAQGDDVSGLIDVIKNRPSGMDRTAWKEKRRDAARKLGERKDKRAVPVLEQVAKDETFDIIGEIAIDALAEIGDASAVPTLQAIAGDDARDEETREKAKKAIAKLGAKVETPAPDAGAGTGSGSATETATVSEPGPEPGPEAEGPRWDDDVLAATERLTFAIGSANLGWDTVRDRLDFDVDVSSIYRRTMDREKTAWSWGGDAHVVAATQDPDGRAASRELLITGEAGGEFRAYTSSGVYAVGFGQARIEATRLTTRDPTDSTQDNSDRWLAVEAQVAIGGGWGRVLDVGTRMRVARIASALEAGKQLGRPIDDGVAKRLQAAWWTTRGALGSHARLTQTVAILRDAGILLGEPDAGTTYELLQILDDVGFDARESGHDVQLAFGEGYLERWRWPSDEDPGIGTGRLEELLVRARVGRQIGATRELGGDAFARLRLFPPMNTPAPWAIGATAHVRQWVYGEHYDPRGAFDLTGELAISSDDNPNTDLGMRLGGELGWTMIVSRASQIRLAGDVTLDAGEVFIGANVTASYGLLDGVFAASPP